MYLLFQMKTYYIIISQGGYLKDLALVNTLQGSLIFTYETLAGIRDLQSGPEIPGFFQRDLGEETFRGSIIIMIIIIIIIIIRSSSSSS